MRAAVLRAFGRPLQLEERPDPVPEDDEVLVRVRAVGLCGTDLKIADGMLEGTPLPLVLGHEIAGEIVEGGQDLEGGEHVALYFYDPCGECRSLPRRGRESLPAFATSRLRARRRSCPAGPGAATQRLANG